ncbi:MAG: hypothetical protein HOO93_10770 [Methyloglobulus sp.]|nr:hypothetical protein [Methyloglobulus sp.]
MRKIYRWLALFISLFSTFSTHSSDKTTENIAVVYPVELNQAKTTIYDEVITGIRSVIPNLSVITHDSEQNNLQALLDANHPARVIALSKQSAAAVQYTTYKDKLVCGLHYFKDTCPGVSLSIGAEDITKSIHELLPKTKRLVLVYETGLVGIDAPRPMTASNGISVQVMPATDTLKAINALGNLVEHDAQAITDVVAIPPNLPEDILFKVVASAWDRNITLITTNLGHLEHGVLMAFVPDPLAMGKQLGVLAMKQNTGWEATKTSKVALNRLVAKHLGLSFGESPFFLRIK